MISIKICGLTNVVDALWALEQGAEYLGFVLYRKSPRCVTAGQLKAICDALPATSKCVGVFVNESAEFVQKVWEECRLSAIQVHGDEDASCFLRVTIPVWRAVRLQEGEWTPSPTGWPAERYVIDAASPEYGGTGVTADWDAAASFSARHRSMLAGGLHPGNVAEAIRRVNPIGVDVSSGVESLPGKKDLGKIMAFIQAVRDGDKGCLSLRREDTKGNVI